MSDNVREQTSAATTIGSRTLHRQTKEILDRVEQTGEPVVILRYGRPAAALVPIDEEHAKTLVLASAPELRERRATQAAASGTASTPFAVAERELADEPAPRQAEVTAMAEETNRLLGIAARRLMLQARRGAVGARRDELNSDLARIDAIQQKTTRALADLVEGFREQAETLTAALGELDVAEQSGGMSAEASPG